MKSMNLLRIYGATLLIALTAGMSACKNEEAPVTTPTTAEAATSGEKISFDVDIAGLPSDDLRMLIQENMQGGKHAGLKFVWNPGDKETLYLAFKRAGCSWQQASDSQELAHDPQERGLSLQSSRQCRCSL